MFRIDRSGEWAQVAEYDGWPNGLKIGSDGRILITDYKLGLVALDPASGAVTPLSPISAARASRDVNDLVIARNGDVYFT